MEPSELRRDFAVFVTLGLIIGALWTQFYVRPHDEFNTIISDCMMQKNDRSVQSYRDCVDENAPNNH